ncbi:MAG: helix-turn-helix transcriptional regulator, partial [Candidatus Thermoplasmatota archaeon]|nr:helix-turn-helix transcriptional regulator [Candidatus Thermoplasmatota archaeon]
MSVSPVKLDNSALIHQSIPLVEAVKEIGGAWKLIVIRSLQDGPAGFNQLMRITGNSNPKSLSRTLRELEEMGIINRTVVSTKPFRVEYSLGEKGRSLGSALEELRKWGEYWAL